MLELLRPNLPNEDHNAELFEANLIVINSGLWSFRSHVSSLLLPVIDFLYTSRKEMKRVPIFSASTCQKLLNCSSLKLSKLHVSPKDRIVCNKCYWR